MRRIRLVLSAMALAIATAVAARADDAIKITSCQVIVAPGSYALAKNILAEPKTLVVSGGGTPQRYACILIDADYVTLDLAGFSVIGDATPETFGVQSGDHKGIVVRNGAVTGFTQSGVSLTGSYHTVENVRAIGNGGNGLSVFGGRFSDRASILRGNVAAENGRSGISVVERGNSLVTGNVLMNNAVYGALVTCPSVVTQNMASGNGLVQIRLYVPFDSSTGPPGAPCTASNNNPE